MAKITIIAQIIQLFDRDNFRRIVEKYKGDIYNKGINSWTHLQTMLFAHLSKLNSLREISNGLKSVLGNLNHLGITKKVPCKSSISYINAQRNWEIFRDYYFSLYEKFTAEANFKQIKFKIKRKIYLLDSSLISLCLEVFDWARYTKTKGAIKLHTLLDYDGCMPSFVNVTDGKVADVTAAKMLNLPLDSVVVADRGYVDFNLLWKWNKNGIKFVLRVKESLETIGMKERPLPEGKDENILIDEDILLVNEKTRKKYPEKLRRVVVYDAKNDKTIILITNQFTWTASTIAKLYKERWQIETFFKILKQNLKIKTFWGTSFNAVMIQIWTALITLLVLKYLKQRAKYNWSLSNLIAFIRLCLFTRHSLWEWLDEPFKTLQEIGADKLQMNFFE